LRRADGVDLSPLSEHGGQLSEWNDAFCANSDDPMLVFDEVDLDRYFAQIGFANVDGDVVADEQEVVGERYLNQVGAPGRPTLLERWQEDFAPGDIERLAGFLRGRTFRVRHVCAYLTSGKP